MNAIVFIDELTAACANHATDGALYQLRELLPALSVEQVSHSSPPDLLPQRGLNFNDEGDGPQILLQVLRAFLAGGVAARLRHWRIVAEMALTYHGSNNPSIKNVLASMLIQLSCMCDSFTIMTLLAHQIVVHEAPFEPDVFLRNYLRSDRVNAAFRHAAGPYFTAVDYNVVPVVMTFEGLHDGLQGFGCFNNVVAIRHHNIVHYEDSPVSRVFVGNLVAHEVQHGIWRARLNRFDRRTPDYYFPGSDPETVNRWVPESGEMHERAMWFGHLPRWHDPLDHVEAGNLAQRIVNAFANPNLDHPIFPTFHPHDVTLGVGVRPSQTVNPALRQQPTQYGTMCLIRRTVHF